MDMRQVAELRAELAGFVADVFASVPRKDQRAKGDCYLRGLMLDGRRKSIQPMAERLPDGNEQNLQQFVNQSTWDPAPVQRRIAERIVPLISPDAWAVDDVSVPKDGRMSVGVARQYCGALGKRANCQVAVSVHAVSDTASCPLQWRLFLPEEWDKDTERRRAAHVPEQAGHREKWRLALDALDELAGWGFTPPVVVADAGYGTSTPFRLALEEQDLSYVLALTGKEVAHDEAAEPHRPAYGGLGPPTLPRYRTQPKSMARLATQASISCFTEVIWREGSTGPMTSRFAVLRVRPAGKQALRAAQEAGGGHYQWDGILPLRSLLVEWPADQKTPTGYWISNLPADTPIEDLVRWAKMRWRIEHDYRELKHGLGLDHFEGRSWRGWHHHVTLVTAAHAFLTEHRLAPKAPSPDSPSTRYSTPSKAS
ncbi:IS701 family transposase [Streptomyces xiangluensis]|uniref:IS701 family transposase n=1 Tax=Streptomyces xiangluensis TaxID=2665720 RepID=A0ABV8YQB6_9ACTN